MSAPPARRAASVGEVRERLSQFRTQASFDAALEFEPRPDDVFIVTYAKSGTTWLQQMVHCLRTGGDMAFGEITEAVPWIEMALDLGLDIHAEQAAAPRAYKTHLPRANVPKGGRYIWVIRDPADVAVSFFHFFEGWFFEAGQIPLDTFTREFFLGGSLSGSYWAHLAGWWDARDGDEVLAFSYEGVKHDPMRAIERVARFAGVPLSEPLRALTLERTSIEFMRAHAQKFDDHLVREARDAACGLPPGGASSKVRRGEVGASRSALTPGLRAEIDARWRQELLPATGCATYEALRAQIDAPT